MSNRAPHECSRAGEFLMKYRPPRILQRIEMPGVQTRLNEAEEQALLKVLREANSLATGPEGVALEKEFAAYLNCGDAVALSSCSAALELSATLTGLGAGDEVIIPAHTFVASAVPFGRTGATIKWADIDPETRNVSAVSIESLISDKTKVIVAVHLYGLPCDMDAIMAVADKHDIYVVEDCAQAPGARYQGKHVGSIGHFGCFSFHTHKNINTLGEGGLLAVRDPKHAVAARRLRWMGNWPIEGNRSRYWEPAMADLVEPLPGQWPVNFCMGEPNAAVGRLLLNRLDDINSQRREQAARFKGYFKDYPEMSFQAEPEGCQHVYHLMSARYDGQSYGKDNSDLIECLFEKYQLKCIVQYWPLNRSNLFKKFGFSKAIVPESDRFFDNMISFPWWSYMGNDLVDDMAQRVISGLEELRGR